MSGISSQKSARASSVGKTPSFRFCQVDMYVFGNSVSVGAVGNRVGVGVAYNVHSLADNLVFSSELFPIHVP